MEIVGNGGLRILCPEPESDFRDELVSYCRVLLKSFSIYLDRNKDRKGVWRNSGLRGQTLNVFAKAERAFGQVMGGTIPDEDHFIDCINYSVFALILLDDLSKGTSFKAILDGRWPWSLSKDIDLGDDFPLSSEAKRSRQQLAECLENALHCARHDPIGGNIRSLLERAIVMMDDADKDATDIEDQQ
jgi:hypothetical protein